MTEKKVLLLDAHSLAYRAFFALPSTMSTREGQPTNAVYGFLTMMFKVLEEEEPDAVIAAFDGPRAELERTREYSGYKANRPSMPDELRSQMAVIEEALRTMGIPVVQAGGHEADDVLGTLSEVARAPGYTCVIVTGDRDALQLASGDTRVVFTSRGISETYNYDGDAVREKYGIDPARMPDMVGLKGDSSDNIPGVPGIGEKGAIALISSYGSLEGLYQHLGEIRGKRRESLEKHREDAFLSRKLATIRRDLELEVSPEKVGLGEWDEEKVLELLRGLEFMSLIERFRKLSRRLRPDRQDGGGSREGDESPAYSIRLVDAGNPRAVAEFEREARESGAVAVAASVNGSGWCNARLEAVAVASGRQCLVACLDREPDSPASKAVSRILESSLEKWVHHGKVLLEVLSRRGLSPGKITFDAALAAYLDNPSASSYEIRDLWERYLGAPLLVDGAPPEDEEQLFFSGSPGEDMSYLGAQAFRVLALKPILEKKLEESGMKGLLLEVEVPFAAVLAGMEEAGVAFDRAPIDALKQEAGEELSRLKDEIHRMAGSRFNIDSTRQTAKVLFEDMGITPVKKTKTGYSTDSTVLEALRDQVPVAGRILEYRERARLKSTYIDGLTGLVCPSTGRIHCSFNQTATATGRISASNPNLQNIPVRTGPGLRIRRAFIPRFEGGKMLVADYSQVELRVLAHLSGDALLTGSFEAGADVHARTASGLFGVAEQEVTPEMRRMAKVVNFGVIYGMGQYGLSSRLGISIEEASGYIERYFESYSGVREYRDRCIREAAEKGYAETILGRRRRLAELGSTNRQVRELGERLAINTPVQGSAADIIKLAMLEINRAMDESRLKSVLTLQVHDELVFDICPGEEELMLELATGLMSRAIELRVPLKVDAVLCDNWGEAKQS